MCIRDSPRIISRIGLLLSTLLLAAIVGVNFITASHILEAMGIANACSHLDSKQRAGPGVFKHQEAVEVSVYIYIQGY